MKKHFLILLFIISVLIYSCGVKAKEDNAEESSSLQNVETITIEETLSEVRPNENELSEKEIMLKLAEAVIELGYNNTEYTDKIDPRLKDSRMGTPEYVYTTNPNADINIGYIIPVVDKEGYLIAILKCNADKEKDLYHFIGSYSLCSYLNFHSMDKMEILELLKIKMPEKIFSEPYVVNIKLNGSPFYEEYWYVAAIENENEEMSKDAFLNPDVKVEEYLINGGIFNYKPIEGDISKALETSNSETNIWGGIIKVEQELGYYKVIEANKTIIDSDGTPKALNDNSAWSEYRGKTLSSMYTGNITATKI